jgi:HAE1 family hydrophobic/amphiphilic exporter-1
MIQSLVGRPVTVAMLAIAIVLIGCISALRTPTNLMPDIPATSLTVITRLSGATPIEIEETITTPLEKSLATLPGLKSTASESSEEKSQIEVVLDPSVDQLEVMSQLRDRLDTTSLPEAATKPAIIRAALNSAPVLVLNFWKAGGNKELLEVAQRLRATLIPQIESVSGIALVRLSGVPVERVDIKLRPDSSLSMGLTPQGIIEAIRGKGRSASAGTVTELDRKIPILLVDSLDSLEDLKRLVVKSSEKTNILLGDVAEVVLEIASPEIRSRLNLRDVLTVEVFKESEANTVAVGKKVRDISDAYIRESKSGNFEGRVIQDRSLEISNAVSEVKSAVFSGALLAGLIIFILLQSWWPSFVITVTIPLSLFFTFSLMYFFGVSFNLMSLSGLALGVGMLVDNSTVVLESINSYYTTLKDRHAASIVGTQSVVGAVSASTFATIAVFAPLVFVQGRIGVLFHDVALTICFSLISSLVVAIGIIPALSASGLSSFRIQEYIKDPARTARLLRQRLFSTLDAPVWTQSFTIAMAVLNWMLVLSSWVLFAVAQRCYKIGRYVFGSSIDKTFGSVRQALGSFEHVLRTGLGRLKTKDRLVIQIFVSVVLFGIFLLQIRGGELFPQQDSTEIRVEIELPPGRRLAQTQKVVERIEARLNLMDPIVDISVKTGEQGEASAVFLLKTRTPLEGRALAALEKSFSTEPELRYRVSKGGGGSGGGNGEEKPVQVLVFSENLETLRDGAARTVDLMRGIDGIRNVDSTIKQSIQQAAFEIAPQRAGLLGIEATAVSQMLRTRLVTAEIPNAQVGNNSYRIRVSPSGDIVRRVEDLTSMYLDAEGQKRIYLDAIGKFVSGTTEGMISHSNRKRVAKVRAEIEDVDLAQANKRIRAKLTDQLKTPWELAGQESERIDSVNQLSVALLMSIVIVFLLLAAQFESLLLPLVVLAAAPLSLVGVGIAMSIWQLNVSAFVLVGLVILVGSSVNTSIVMVDLANQLRAKGRSWGEAIVEATVLRCRPIIITTLSNLLGLLPLAIDFGSSGASTQKPMAVTLIGGLVTSTLLTLFMVPSFYTKLGELEEKNQDPDVSGAPVTTSGAAR